MKHTTIFDVGKGYAPITNLMTFTDCTVVKRENQWWMFAGGDGKTLPEINLFSASLPKGS